MYYGDGSRNPDNLGSCSTSAYGPVTTLDVTAHESERAKAQAPRWRICVDGDTLLRRQRLARLFLFLFRSSRLAWPD
jgi:hypothetical protein